MNRFTSRFLGFLLTFTFMFIILITSIEAVVYWDKNYFENEYKKYDIANSIDINFNDLMYVTDEMMLYLKGNRENLDIYTNIKGEYREFFNEREKLHMIDVKNLFQISQNLRICFLIFDILILILMVKFGKLYDMCFSLVWGIGIFILLVFGIIFAAILDFEKSFTIFHKIFFNNDLWILDPRTDLLINIVPQEFFMDTAFRIGTYFSIVIILIFLISIFTLKRKKVK